MVFSKRSAPEHGLSCTIWKDGIFPPETLYFFIWWKIRDDVSQEIHGNMIFSAYTCGCYKREAMSLCQKKKKKKKKKNIIITQKKKKKKKKIKDDLIPQKYT